MASAVHNVRPVLYDLRARYVEVLRHEQLTPRMRRVTFGGADLADLPWGAPSDHVKLFFGEPDDPRPPMPQIGPDNRWSPPADGRKPIHRDYTIRRLDREALELDLDFVLHGTGVASTWAEQVRPGQVLGVLGPRGSHLVPLDFDWYLLGGDETALPAIGRWLELLPADARAYVIAEVAGRDEEQPLPSAADVELRWLHRDAGGPSLEAAIRALEPPEGDGFCWIAGEAGSLRPVRRYLRDELRLNPDWIDVDGYWKRGTVNLDHHVADED